MQNDEELKSTTSPTFSTHTAMHSAALTAFSETHSSYQQC